MMWYQVLIGGVSLVTLFSLTVSIPVYILVLAAIILNRHVEPFGSEFFSIFIALGFVDIGCYLLFLCKKLIFFGFIPSFLLPFNQPNAFCSYFYYPFWVLGFLQYQLTFFLTLNRHFSIVMPCFYLQSWTPTFTRRAIICCITFSAILPLPVLISDCQISEYVAFQSEGGKRLHYGPYTTSPTIDRYLKSVWAFHVYGLVLSSIVFYGLVLSSIVFYGFMVKKLRENRQYIMKQKRKRIEFQMFCVGFIVFLMNLAFTVYFVLRDMVLIRLTNNTHIHEWLLYFMADIYDLPNGYILLIFSERVRRIVLRYACGHGFFGAVEPLSFSMLSIMPPTHHSQQSQQSSSTTNQERSTVYSVGDRRTRM